MQLNQRREQHYDPIGQSVAKDVLAHSLRVEPEPEWGRRAGDFAPVTRDTTGSLFPEQFEPEWGDFERRHEDEEHFWRIYG